MRKWKLSASSTLAAAMAVSLLAGCSSSAPKPAEPTAPSPAAAKEESKKEAANPVKITVELLDFGAIPESEGTITNNRWTKYVQEEMLKQGVEVEFFIVPRTQEVEKVNVLMASGSAPDIIMTYDRTTFLNYAKMGGLTDLTPYMDKAGSNIKKYFGEEMLKYAKVDNKLFAVPARRSSFALNGHFIRQDWLDKLKLPMPETLDDLYKTLKAFKDNAQTLGTKDVLPIGISTNTDALNVFFNAFMKTPTEEDLATTPLFLRDGYLDGLKYVNKLYHEGMMNREFGLDSNAQKLRENMMNNQIGFSGSHSAQPWLDYPDLRTKVPGANMVAFKGVKNKSDEFFLQQGVEIGFYNMIPKTSKNPEAAVKYLDWMINEGGSKIWFGFEGEHYVMKDGIKTIKDGAYNIKTLDWMRGWLATTYNMTADRDKEMQNKLLQSRFAGEDGTNYLQAIKTFEKYGKRAYVFETVMQKEVKYGAALSKLFKDSLAKLIMSPPDKLEAEYKKFVDEYLKTGGQEVMDEAKAAYKAAKK